MVKSGSLERRLPLLAFCASLALLIAGAFMKGSFTGHDTGGYLTAGAALADWLAADEPPVEHITDSFIFPHYLIATVYLYGINDGLALGRWGVLSVNLLLFSLLAAMLFSLWSDLPRRDDKLRPAGMVMVVLAGGLYTLFGLPDGFLWSYGVLTDLLFLFWVGTFVVLTVRALLAGRAALWAGAALMAVTAPFVRPTGLVVPLLFVFALVLGCVPVMRRRPTLAALVSIALPALVLLTVVPWLILMQADPQTDARWLVPDILHQPFLQTVHFFKQGVAVANRVELAPGATLSYLEVLTTMVYRLAYYWVPLRFGADSYSLAHNAINGLYMLFALPLLLRGVRKLYGTGATGGVVALFLVMVAILFALQHAVTLVAFDWRYQVPAMVPLWILVGYGFQDTVSAWADRQRH